MFLLDLVPDYPRDPAPAPSEVTNPTNGGLFGVLSQQDLTIALVALGVAIVLLVAIIVIKKK